jgi:hypothetical protein
MNIPHCLVAVAFLAACNSPLDPPAVAKLSDEARYSLAVSRYPDRGAYHDLERVLLQRSAQLATENGASKFEIISRSYTAEQNSRERTLEFVVQLGEEASLVRPQHIYDAAEVVENLRTKSQLLKFEPR